MVERGHKVKLAVDEVKKSGKEQINFNILDDTMEQLSIF